MDYPWFEVVEGDEISQGDIIMNCPVVIVPPLEDLSEGAEFDVVMKTIDVIIMTQACDLEQGKVNDVILCGITGLKDLKMRDGKKATNSDVKNISNGRIVNLHLLNEYVDEELSCDHRVVDLRQLYSLPLETLKVIAKSNGKRLRLLPPYREHLSQAFARLFMRVGLPSDIDLTKVFL
jgi:hypothetical protein